ncbi:hypothetical protein [Vibrio ulleungensis]|uniref:Uncharacterized protein n=1 Tax=Vibrio ulleungensis TaxID=2807619 RepID=A0ABS2HD88_9VIBR|nr:hypothetical protein [Vibrio ulleungensis]MBM7035004.1 hypothetical protein [Vibrio ulleungensis]
MKDEIEGLKRKKLEILLLSVIIPIIVSAVTYWATKFLERPECAEQSPLSLEVQNSFNRLNYHGFVLSGNEQKYEDFFASMRMFQDNLGGESKHLHSIAAYLSNEVSKARIYMETNNSSELTPEQLHILSKARIEFDAVVQALSCGYSIGKDECSICFGVDPSIDYSPR